MFDINYIINVLKPTLRTWVTVEGDRIRVSNMSDEHLLNTIDLLRQNNAESIITFPTLIDEAKLRKLIAE